MLSNAAIKIRGLLALAAKRRPSTLTPRPISFLPRVAGVAPAIVRAGAETDRHGHHAQRSATYPRMSRCRPLGGRAARRRQRQHRRHRGPGARARGARHRARLARLLRSRRTSPPAQASHDWILSVDADERVTPELAAEIRERADPRAGGRRLSRAARDLAPGPLDPHDRLVPGLSAPPVRSPPRDLAHSTRPRIRHCRRPGRSS